MNRKHLHIVLLWVFIYVMTPCNAQPKDSLKLNHEVSLGIGTLSVMDAFAVSPRVEIHGQYLYNINKCIGLGALAVFESYKTDEGWLSYGSNNGFHLTLNPAARFYWFNKKHFAMYSKLGAGVSIGGEQEIHIIPMINISAIALEFGGRQWRVFTELFPIGTLGMLNLGVKKSF